MALVGDDRNSSVSVSDIMAERSLVEEVIAHGLDQEGSPVTFVKKPDSSDKQYTLTEEYINGTRKWDCQLNFPLNDHGKIVNLLDYTEKVQTKILMLCILKIVCSNFQWKNIMIYILMGIKS